MKVFPLKLVVGGTVSLPITQKEINFYKWLSASILKMSEDEICIERMYARPISDEEETYSHKVTIQHRIDEVKTAINKEESDTVLLVDIEVKKAATFRAKSHLILLRELKSALLTLTKKPSSIIYISSEFPRSPGDFLFAEIAGIEDEGIVIFSVDEEGRVFGNKETNESEVRERRILSKAPPANSLRFKLIRQLGHFTKVIDNSVVCLRHFYDGSRCIDEIRDYLWLKLYKEIDESSIILYHSSRSPWLETAIRSLWSKFSCTVMRADDFDRYEYPNYNKIHIVLDFIDSGSTLHEFLEKSCLHPTSVIAVLSTRSKEKHDKIESELGIEYRRYLEINDRKIYIDYVTEADFQILGNRPCKLCDLPLPHEHLPEVHSSTGLRSIDFWTMVLESGIGDEKNPPEYRHPQSYILDSSNLIEQYGGVLAHKVDQLITRLGLSNTLTIVLPESEGGSNWYSHFLELILDIDSVPIPRNTINRFSKGNSDFTEEEKCSEWFKNLLNSPIKNCLVIDDIVITGKSIRGIFNVLRRLNKNCAVIIPIVYVENPDINMNIDSFYPLYTIGV